MAERHWVSLVFGGIDTTMLGQVDLSHGNVTSPSSVDDDLLEFHRVGGWARRYRLLDAVVDVDNQTTASMVTRAAAILIPMHCVKARDLWGVVLLAELCFLDQRHVNSVVLQDICQLVEFYCQ